VTERVAAAMTAVAEAARALADAVVRPAGAAWSAATDPGDQGDRPAGVDPPAGAPPGRRVEPIDLA
jgi:hypothetical protein